MAQVQLLLLPFHKYRAATKSGNAGKIREICVQSEKTKKERQILEKSRESWKFKVLYCFIPVQCSSLYSITYSIEYDCRQILPSLSFIPFCGVFMQHISMFHKTKNLNVQKYDEHTLNPMFMSIQKEIS